MASVDTFKKLGFSATVAAVIASAITITPFVFKIDERYAKTEALEHTIAINDQKINQLSAELGKLVGVTNTLVTVIGLQQEANKDMYHAELPRPIVRAQPVAPQAIPNVDWPEQNIAGAAPPPPPVMAAPPPPPEPVMPAPMPERLIADTPNSELRDADIKDILRQANDSLKETQRNVQEIQDQE